ncbi:982_t:CDS:1, partial [Racocetra fulgida]
IIENWVVLLRDEQLEEDLNLDNLDDIVYLTTSQNAKWPL